MVLCFKLNSKFLWCCVSSSTVSFFGVVFQVQQLVSVVLCLKFNNKFLWCCVQLTGGFYAISDQI